MMRTQKWFLYVALMLMVVACTPVVAPVATSTGTPASIDSSVPGDSTTMPAEGVVLMWKGYTELVDGDTTKCKVVTVDAEEVVRHGICDEENSMTVAEGYLPLHWREIQSRFAPFMLASEQETVIFQGSGEIEGEAWQRAIASYARTSYGEAVTGRVGASVRTAMSWWLSELSEQPGFCPHLVLLNYGYAYISIGPCTGGEPIARGEGWLESREWETVEQWFYSRAPLYQENNYFAALGTEEMSESEIDDLVQWVEATYTRLAESAAMPISFSMGLR